MITIPNCIATVVLAWFSCLFFPLVSIIGILEDWEATAVDGMDVRSVSVWGKKRGFVSWILWCFLVALGGVYIGLLL
jgi:hypothetical protein